MTEFRQAHAHATGKSRNKFLIPLLYEDINIRDLDTGLKLYLENHTYIECKSMVTVNLKNKQNPERNLSYEKEI